MILLEVTIARNIGILIIGLSDIAITTVKGVGYHCIIHEMNI